MIMDILVSIIYALVLGFIRSYKFIELQLFKLINYPLRRVAIYLGEKVGLILLLPGEPEVSLTEEKRILKESGYPTVLRIKVNDVSIFPLLANQGALGFLEGYMDGKWELVGDDVQLTELFNRMLVKDLMGYYFHPINKFLHYLEIDAFNLQTIGRAFQIADKHYDVGNTLIESFLGPTMQYSSAYWASADNLNDAQINKMELIAKKLDLKPGMRVLDVGCGWGILCKYLAENYGVECVGISVSKEGIKYGKSKMGNNLNVELRVQDYRDLNEKFDRIVSIECLEHVGPHNYRTFFKAMKNSLKDDGIFLLHCTGINHKNMISNDPFIHKYLLPNLSLPYYRDVCKHIEGSFIIEDWHNIGPDFGKTLKAWAENFGKQKTMVCDKYGERVYKLWNLYFLFSSAGFKSRKVQVWQIVLSKNGLLREYRAAR